MVPPLAALAILAVPLIEIAVFVLVGSQIGALATVGLVIATTVLGAILLRVQGFGVLARLRETMERGGQPGRDLVHGAMIMIAGVLLFLPGFVTDAVGLLLFIPPVRDVAWRFLSSRIVVVSPGQAFRQRPRDGRTIDLDADDYSTNDGPQKPYRPLEDDR